MTTRQIVSAIEFAKQIYDSILEKNLGMLEIYGMKKIMKDGKWEEYDFEGRLKAYINVKNVPYISAKQHK